MHTFIISIDLFNLVIHDLNKFNMSEGNIYIS